MRLRTTSKWMVFFCVVIILLNHARVNSKFPFLHQLNIGGTQSLGLGCLIRQAVAGWAWRAHVRRVSEVVCASIETYCRASREVCLAHWTMFWTPLQLTDHRSRHEREHVARSKAWTQPCRGACLIAATMFVTMERIMTPITGMIYTMFAPYRHM